MGYYEKTIATIAERREGERRGAREREREGEGNVVNAERQRERERETERWRLGVLREVRCTMMMMMMRVYMIGA